MATATKDKPKKENFATVEEAIAGAGTSVLSHLDSYAHKLTVDEVKEYEEDLALTGPPKEGEYKAYGGPYDDPNDERNVWTAEQTGGAERTVAQIEKKDEPKKPAQTQTAPHQQPPPPPKK